MEQERPFAAQHGGPAARLQRAAGAGLVIGLGGGLLGALGETLLDGSNTG